MCLFYPTTKMEACEDVVNMENIVLFCEKKSFLFMKTQQPLYSLRQSILQRLKIHFRSSILDELKNSSNFPKTEKWPGGMGLYKSSCLGSWGGRFITLISSWTTSPGHINKIREKIST